MSVTRAQVNAVKATILDRLFQRYEFCQLPAVRVAVHIHKNNPAQREAIQAILQDAYRATTGRDPLAFGHNFKQWLREACQNANDPTTGVDVPDAVDPVPAVVT